MDKDKCDCKDNCCSDNKKFWKHAKYGKLRGGHGMIYPLGVLGALVYFLNNVTNFQGAVVGVFKAIFWPAFVIFKVLELLKL